MGRGLSLDGVSITEAWGEHYRLWHGNRITLWVHGPHSVQLQISRSQPPDPPLWDDPIYVPKGEFSRATSFGWFRFRCPVPGGDSLVTFSAESA